MTTGNFTDWSGNMLDLGPLYPFVGWEGLMVVLALIAWIGWHILQLRAEKSSTRTRRGCCARAAIWPRPSRRSAPSSGSSGALRVLGAPALRCRPCPKPRNVGGEARTTLQG